MVKQQVDQTSQMDYLATSVACAGCPQSNCVVCGSLDSHGPACQTIAVDRFAASAGEILAREGRPSAHVIAVIDGMVMSYKELPVSRRQVTRFHFPGDLIALSGSAPCADVTIEAITPVLVCRFRRDALRRSCSGHPGLADRLLDLGADETTAGREHMLLLGRKSALEKVASFLVELACRASREGVVAAEIALPMARGDIADYLGLTVETVSRRFTRLKVAEIVDFPTMNRVVLRDWPALSALAGTMPRPRVA
jgi:CRP/FNR family transcriptional regulator, anaerobic regulatory protein